MSSTSAPVRINLLPHREQKRIARQRQFVSLAFMLGILALGVVGLVHFFLSTQIEAQESRNKLLKSEIAKLDEQIKEIDKLRDQIAQVLSRKQVVETLQANRNEAVHLLDRLPDMHVDPENIDFPELGRAPQRETYGVLRPIENYPLD